MKSESRAFSFRHSLTALSAVLALGAGVFHPAHAQGKAAPQPVDLAQARGGGVVVSVAGEIVAVDVANRIVSVKGPEGNVADLVVDPRVRNLEQVKVGDRVHLTYQVGVALALLKGGDGIREKVESEAAARSAPGTKPGGALARTTTVVANVEAVNHKEKIVTLKGPEGKVLDVYVDDPQVLGGVKVGDQVGARITASVAIGVQPAQAQ